MYKLGTIWIIVGSLVALSGMSLMILQGVHTMISSDWSILGIFYGILWILFCEFGAIPGGFIVWLGSGE